MKIRTMRNGDVDVTFGTDLEFFVISNETGKIVPASKVIPGTKGRPHQLEHGVCHPDGLSVEVACPPSDTPEGMFENIDKVIQEVKEKFLDPANVSISDSVKARLEDVDGATASDLDYGCGTEYNAYSGSRGAPSAGAPHRFSGFHIHLGFTEHDPSLPQVHKDMECLVKTIDSIFRSKGVYPNEHRTSQYGGFGAYRPKPYGVEYRALGADNFFRDKESIIACLNKVESIFSKATSVAREEGIPYIFWGSF